MELFDLDRFLSAQDNFNTYDTALEEVKEGSKRTHWIWYIFPQIHGLGHSSTSQKYSIKSLLEARAYLEDNKLRDRLYEITHALLDQDNSARDIFGGLDAMKVCSCMTLFDIVSPDDIFAEVIEKFFDNTRCGRTLEIIQKEQEYYKADSAFERNGIHAPEKAFLEAGSEESNQFPEEVKIGTLLDLFSRGDYMTDIVSRYLWHKDMSAYRTSGVESTIRQYFGSLINSLCEHSTDEKLLKEAMESEQSLCMEDSNVLLAAKAFDDFLRKYSGNADVEDVKKDFVKHSLCKPLDTKGKRFYNNIERPAFTPERLSVLKNDEIFVFGSNLAGMHGGGAARAAKIRFGAVMGQGVGLQGQSYAIPTMQGGVETIKPYVDEFTEFAQDHEDLFFYVTRIGCGIAGFKDEEIAPLFNGAACLQNVCLPESFVKILKETVPSEIKDIVYGQMRTMVDLLKSLNKEERVKNADDAFHRLEELIQRNVRYGDEYAFMALRTLWCLASQYEHERKEVDIEKLEKDMMEFHNKNSYIMDETITQVFYHYSVSKMIKYIQFLNDFRRYTSYEQIREDLPSISFSHCSPNDERYYFSFNRFAFYELHWILEGEWDKVCKNGALDNDALEEVVFGRYQRALSKYGIHELIRLAYGQVGCHPDIKGPMRLNGEQIHGPFFGVHGSFIAKGCSDLRRWPGVDGAFEMEFAHEILDKDENYIHVNVDCYDEAYIPRNDYSLPVYSRRRGKMKFVNEAEKAEFIKKALKDAH